MRSGNGSAGRTPILEWVRAQPDLVPFRSATTTPGVDLRPPSTLTSPKMHGELMEVPA